MTKRKLAAEICKLEGKKAQVAFSNMMESLSAKELVHAQERVNAALERPAGAKMLLACSSKSELEEAIRISKLAAKLWKKANK